MAKMHYCTAKVNLSGQNYHIVVFEPTSPLSWPEAQLLMQLHGEENVMEIKPVFVAETSATEEKRRLLGKYATQAKVVEHVFPGRTPRMELLMPAEDDNQPRVDSEGFVEAATDEQPAGDPPMDPPVFKPGRHRPPQPAEKPEA
jgi:LmbE family N-acetylglucosaminyl deacetylase